MNHILIVVGAIFNRVDFGGLLYVSELLGAALGFVGFLRAITPVRSTRTVSEVTA